VPDCAHCTIHPEEAWIATERAVAVPHPEPLATCHMVVAPRRHVEAFYDLDVQEQREVWAVVTEIRDRVARSMRTEGFDIGFADSQDGGHALIHVVPRLPGQRVVLPADIEWVDAAGQIM
jgi:diadenosine tetraphosphate (Ap4A) HIT family hydrolase